MKQSIKDYQTRDALQTDEMKDLDGAMTDAAKLKFLDKVLTPERGQGVRADPAEVGSGNGLAR